MEKHASNWFVLFYSTYVCMYVIQVVTFIFYLPYQPTDQSTNQPIH